MPMIITKHRLDKGSATSLASILRCLHRPEKKWSTSTCYNFNDDIQNLLMCCGFACKA